MKDLTGDKQRALNDNHPSKHRPKNNEQLSEQDIRELMGLNRDRYQRVKGRVKRK